MLPDGTFTEDTKASLESYLTANFSLVVSVVVNYCFDIMGWAGMSNAAGAGTQTGTCACGWQIELRPEHESDWFWLTDWKGGLSYNDGRYFADGQVYGTTPNTEWQAENFVYGHLNGLAVGYLLELPEDCEVTTVVMNVSDVGGGLTGSSLYVNGTVQTVLNNSTTRTLTGSWTDTLDLRGAGQNNSTSPLPRITRFILSGTGTPPYSP